MESGIRFAIQFFLEITLLLGNLLEERTYNNFLLLTLMRICRSFFWQRVMRELRGKWKTSLISSMRFIKVLFLVCIFSIYTFWYFSKLLQEYKYKRLLSIIDKLPPSQSQVLLKFNLLKTEFTYYFKFDNDDQLNQDIKGSPSSNGVIHPGIFDNLYRLYRT